MNSQYQNNQQRIRKSTIEISSKQKEIVESQINFLKESFMTKHFPDKSQKENISLIDNISNRSNYTISKSFSIKKKEKRQKMCLNKEQIPLLVKSNRKLLLKNQYFYNLPTITNWKDCNLSEFIFYKSVLQSRSIKIWNGNEILYKKDYTSYILLLEFIVLFKNYIKEGKNIYEDVLLVYLYSHNHNIELVKKKIFTLEFAFFYDAFFK